MQWNAIERRSRKPDFIEGLGILRLKRVREKAKSLKNIIEKKMEFSQLWGHKVKEGGRRSD